MSILDPLSCGFAKVIGWEVMTEKLKKEPFETEKCYKSRQMETRYQNFCSNYKNCVTYTQFKSNFPNLLEYFRKIGKTNTDNKKKLLALFSGKEFKKLKTSEQNKHVFENCKQCCNAYKNEVLLFPAFTNKYKKCANKLQENASKSSNETLNRRTELAKQITGDIENQWRNTSVERAFGGTTSMRQRNALRKQQCFEPFADAKLRVEQEIQQIASGQKRKRSHTGSLCKYEWDKENCLSIIDGINDGGEINFTDLARKCQLKNEDGKLPKNGGQVMKELLVTENVDLTKFKNRLSDNFASNDSFRIRRKKRRLNISGLTDVSLPVEPTNDEVKQLLKEKISQGTYTVGELIVPQIFDKVFMGKNGEIVTEKVSVNGRKVSFEEIRDQLLKDHLCYMRLHTDEQLSQMSREELVTLASSSRIWIPNNISADELRDEIKKSQRTRYWSCWHDNSTIGGHSYLLITVNVLYNTMSFLSDDEYFKISGKNVNVQSCVEKPKMYLLAQCPSNDQQLLYSQDRIEDILSFQSPIYSDEKNIEIIDKMRIFKGDAPARQFEIGQQKGGNHFCVTCNISSGDISRYSSSSFSKILDIQKRIEKIFQTQRAKESAKEKETKIFTGLKKDIIVYELGFRGADFRYEWKVKDLQQLLDKEMHGIQRLPALLYDNPTKSVSELNLSCYEVLPLEPLHDVSNHVKNLYEEIPSCFPKEEKKKIADIISKSFNGKEAKNSSDYRKSLLTVTNWFMTNKKNHFVTELLILLSEIQEILYAPEVERSIVKILRLYLITFRHAVLIKMHLSKELNVLTERKFFGTYFHSIIHHSPAQYRFISGRSANTEKEEALFAVLKKYTNAATNFQPDNIIMNAFIRHQVREGISEPEKKEDSFLKKLYEPIKLQLSNSIIPFEWIEKFPNDYQSFLQNISDFLIDTSSVWWEETASGILFKDKILYEAPTITDLQLKNVNNSSLIIEKRMLESAWDVCLKNRNKIPAKRVKYFDESGECQIEKLTTIMFFQKGTDNIDNLPGKLSTAPAQKNEELHPVNVPLSPTSLNADFCTTSVSEKVDCINETPNSTCNTLNEIFGKQKIQETPNQNASLTNSNNSLQTELADDLPKTSTPLPVRTKIKIPSIHTTLTTDNDDINVKFNHCIHPSIERHPQSPTLSKSSVILLELGIDPTIVNLYDKKRKRIKSSDHKGEFYDDYKGVLAQIEVPLKGKEDELKKQLKELEQKCLKESAAISVVPNKSVDKDLRKRVVLQLQQIKFLKREFRF